jgi:hypothetical protein
VLIRNFLLRHPQLRPNPSSGRPKKEIFEGERCDAFLSVSRPLRQLAYESNGYLNDYQIKCPVVYELFVVADDDDDLVDVQIGCTDALGTGLRANVGAVCGDYSVGDTGGNVVGGEKAQAAPSCTEPTL